MKAILEGAECTRRQQRDTIQIFKSRPGYFPGLKDKVLTLVGS